MPRGQRAIAPSLGCPTPQPRPADPRIITRVLGVLCTPTERAARAAGLVAGGDGRPVYGMGGLDGLGGRIGGEETTSAGCTGWADGSLHVAKVRVAGSNPVVRSKKSCSGCIFLVGRARGSFNPSASRLDVYQTLQSDFCGLSW